MKSFIVLAALATALLTAAPADDFTTGQAARLVIGQSSFTQSDYGAQGILIGSASGIAVANGNLYLVDANHFTAQPTNNRVLIIPTGTFPKPTDDISTLPPLEAPLPYNCFVCVGRATVTLGQPDANNNAVNLSRSGFRNPVGVATDGVRLIVADTDNNRVLIWNSIPTQPYNQPADVVIGQPDFTHNNTFNPPTAKSMRGPQGVWLSGGRLFVADTQDNRVLIYNTVPSSNGASADIVIGQSGFANPVPTLVTAVIATASSLYSPVSVTTDGIRMFVTDLGNSRVLIWNRIPTANNTAADIVLGQKDLSSNRENDVTNLCVSTGTDTSGNVLYPRLCGKTMSFPRFALSDGTRLYVADGGNDRVLIYSTIPTTSAVAPDIILGQIDDVTDNASDGASFMYTPTSLAWDGTNLYVSDTFNRRVLAYSPGAKLLPLSAVRNAASLEVFASGRVAIGGTVTAKDTVALTIVKYDVNGNSLNTKTYTYTVLSTDSVSDIVAGLAALVNASPGDPNATAYANTATNTILLTAKTGGVNGTLIGYSTTLSTSATATATTAGTNLAINLADATQLAPGSLVSIFGTNLSDATYTGQPDAGGYFPFSLGGVEVFVDGIRAPLVLVSPTQLNVQLPYPVFDRTSSSVYVRIARADGTVTATTPQGVSIVGANPGIFAAAGVDPRPGYVYHAFANATGVVSVDGGITPGNVGTISIGTTLHAAGNINFTGTATPGDKVSVTVTLLDSASATVNTATYTYAVQTGDTLDNIVNGLVILVNTGSDPNVTAAGNTAAGVIQLTARAFGNNGIRVSYSATTSGTSTTIATNGSALVLVSKTYSYTVNVNDTLNDVLNNFVAQINSDPNATVTAQASNVFTRLLLIAKQPGLAGEAIPISASVSTGTDLILTALSAQTCCSSPTGGLVTDANPAQPGEIVYILATGLGLTTNGIPTGQAAGPGNADQPTTPVDSILAGGSTANILFTNYVQGQIGTFQVVFQLSSSLTTDAQSQLAIAQASFVSNVVTFNVTVAPTIVGSARKAAVAPKPVTKQLTQKKMVRPSKQLQRRA